MKTRLLTSGLLAFGLSALTANACFVSGVVSCPNGQSAAGIRVYVPGDVVRQDITEADGTYAIGLNDCGGGVAQTVCVDESTLPAGFKLVGKNCQEFTVVWPDAPYADINFTIEGPACTPPEPGPCWLTGGGTIGKTKGVANFSYGGVVNPGCSPIAAGGGNWNVIDHLQSLHFKGLFINVIGCSGVADKAPKVNVNIIDFEGVGILEGIADNPMPVTGVCFRARAIDSGEPGSGKDALYLNVFDCTTHESLLLISTDTTPQNIAPVAVSTGNLQIHTTGCGKYAVQPILQY